MEELEELEPIDEGEISAVSPAPPRTSIPPPIPKHALERASHTGEHRATLVDGRVSAPPPLPGRMSSAPPVRSSLPPAPPPAGGAPSSPAPSSGIYRIPENKTEIDRWKDVVRELELKVRLRDDLISELKRSLEEHKKLEARIHAIEAKASAAEARATSAEERASTAEARASSAELRASVAPAVAAPPDDLKRIKGIGPAFERKLRELGVTSYAHVAAWTEPDIERIAEALAILPQRITRDGWLESARQLQLK